MAIIIFCRKCLKFHENAACDYWIFVPKVHLIKRVGGSSFAHWYHHDNNTLYAHNCVYILLRRERPNPAAMAQSGTVGIILEKCRNLFEFSSTVFLPVIDLFRPFFGISLTFARHLFDICSTFVRHLFDICLKFVWHLFGICSAFVRHLFVNASTVIWHLFSICSTFVCYLFDICTSFLESFLWNIFDISSTYIWHFFDISSTFLQQIFDKSSTNLRQIIDKSSTNLRQIFDKSSTNHRQIIDKSSTNHWHFFLQFIAIPTTFLQHFFTFFYSFFIMRHF
jgi:hypothetical protein